MHGGGVRFEAWWARVFDLDARLAELERDESIPPGPDRNRIEGWSVDAHLRVWSASE
jgi:hypothetical protein